MTRPTILDLDLVVVPRDTGDAFASSSLPKEMIDAGHDVLEQCDVDLMNSTGPDWDYGMEAVATYRAMLSASPYPTAWDDVRKYAEGLERQVAFTMTDTSRMLRKSDIKDVCPHPDDCFYEAERARCGPCAVKASKLAGIEIDDTHSHLPEVCRLRREVKASEARIAELEAALDEKEVASGLTSNGNLWQFWSTKASAVAVRNAELEKRLADADVVVEPLLHGARVAEQNGYGDDDVLTVTVAECRAARAYMEGKL